MSNRFSASLAAFFMALSAQAAVAGDKQPAASFTVERHHTTNALDSGTALADWYSVMRGTLQGERDLGGATLSLKGDLSLSRYDTYRIEDDVKGTVAATLGGKLADRIELRGTVAWHGASDGDDIAIEGITIGTRTPTHTISANLEAGASIGKDRTLVIEVANSFEHYGKTAFEQDVIDPLKLDADRLRHRATATVNQKMGNWSFGLRGFGGIAPTETLGDPPVSLSFAEAGLRGLVTGTVAGNITIAGALGLELLAAFDGSSRHLVPVGKLALEIPLGKWATLSPDLESKIETRDTDDALGSWVRRAQAEIAIPLGESIKLGAGLFAQSVRNLTLDYHERGIGAYGEIAYGAPGRFRIVLRSEYEQERYPQLDEAKRTLDTFLGFRAEL